MIWATQELLFLQGKNMCIFDPGRALISNIFDEVSIPGTSGDGPYAC